MVCSTFQAKQMLLIALLVIASFQNVSSLVKTNEECKGRNESVKDDCVEAFKGGISLVEQDDQVVLDNGILQVTFSNPGGAITRIQYNGIDNLIEYNESHRLHGGYWDINWDDLGKTGLTGKFDLLDGTSYKIIEKSTDRVEISFMRKWDFSNHSHSAPLNIDKRFIMLNNSSGFYSYAIFEHTKDMPGFLLYEARLAFMLQKVKFRYMAIDDYRQRYMPLPDDRSADRSKKLDYKEAVLLVDPIEPQFVGQVDDKYMYSCENKDCKVHGWIGFDPPVGFWQINPSNEFKTGGPTKQDLTSHVGPVTLSMFVSTHYGGKDVQIEFKDGEPWKKVFGPAFIYLNSVAGGSASLLWNDAKDQMEAQVRSWPYEFPNSEDFPRSDQRGTVIGRLLVQDWYLGEQLLPAASANVGLALPGERGSWQSEGKGYQFWTTSDDQGYFRIDNVRVGNYNIYAWVPGFIGDYHLNDSITVPSGYYMEMGDIVYEPPRFGPTLWEIGIPDRSAAEFYIPDPDPAYPNNLFLSSPDRFRQYGLWERYTDLYPYHDLVYTAGYSDYRRDWFFAQVTRKTGNNSYEATTWEIDFYLENVYQGGVYNLLVALASANEARLQVRINDPRADPPHFSTGLIGHDNAIARHGIHGLYRLYRVEISSAQLVQGQNSIFLTQASGSSPFRGVMYDYIRLDGPSPNGYLSYGPSSSY